MRVLFSRTGSVGNCTVIESASGQLLCIDAGIPYNKVNKEIGYRLHECRNLLLTHQHADHGAYRSVYSNRGMKVYYPEENAVDSAQKPLYEIDCFRVISFPLVHYNSDVTGCPCYGFLIQDTTSGEKLIYCTDTAYIANRFNALEFYCIEANFWEQAEYLDNLDAIEKIVEIRRVNSHLSVQSAVDFLKKQDLSKCKEIRLLHLSGSMTAQERERIIPYIKSEIKREDINVYI